MPYSNEQLNYFRMVHIVMTIFSKALRDLFKEEWRKFYGSKWRDSRADGYHFFRHESSLNKQQNRRALKTIRNGDSSKFDDSVLFYCILYSDSIGTDLHNRNSERYDEIDHIRVLRNEVCHMPKDEVKDGDFQSFCSETIDCFNYLNLSTKELEAIAKEESFVTDEVERLKAKLKREQLAVREYEQYFCKKLAIVKDFNPRPYLEQMRDQGILSEREVKNIKKQKKKEIKLDMLVDSVFYKRPEAVGAFLKLVSERDPEAASSFKDFFSQSKQMEDICNYIPKTISRATVKYPKHCKLIMQTFTSHICKRDWDKLTRESAYFLDRFQDPTTKLFVQIELAYGYIIKDESEKAMGLLNDTITNASKAGENCLRILARALARKSLELAHKHKYSESRALAEEGSMIVSTMESPEEQILCQKRIADCLLYKVRKLRSKKEKLTTVWNTIIELCQRNQDGVPRSSFYRSLVFADKARLHLGFPTGFDSSLSAISDFEEAERCVQRLGLKTDSEDMYTDAFRLICKGKIAYDKGRVADDPEEEEKWLRKSFSLCEEAATACNEAVDGVYNLAQFITGRMALRSVLMIEL